MTIDASGRVVGQIRSPAGVAECKHSNPSQHTTEDCHHRYQCSSASWRSGCSGFTHTPERFSLP
jgi:hypothetical protein